jgi:hypothetical protein
MGGVYAEGYADDIFLLAIGKFPHTVSGLIQWFLNTVEKWCGRLGLTVNPEKTGLQKKKETARFLSTLSFWKGSAMLHVGQVSGSDPGLKIDMEGTC